MLRRLRRLPETIGPLATVALLLFGTSSPALAYWNGGSAQSCYAGPSVCPMQTPVTAGGTCWCRGNNGGRVYGRAS